ncbi:MAG TPA: zf-HC2 domain-containing protein [Gemmatimonadaceae bacterium]
MTPDRIIQTICPRVRDGDDEIPRQWASGELPPDQAAEFETHLRTCTGCQRAVEHAAGVTAALRTAATGHTAAPSPVRRIALVAVVVVMVLTLWIFMRSVAPSP